MQGVLLVFDPFEGREPFDDGVTVEGPDTMAEESVRAGVDHVVPDGWKVDHALVLVTGDRQVSNQSHLVSVEQPAVNLIGPR